MEYLSGNAQEVGLKLRNDLGSSTSDKDNVETMG